MRIRYRSRISVLTFAVACTVLAYITWQSSTSKLHKLHVRDTGKYALLKIADVRKVRPMYFQNETTTMKKLNNTISTESDDTWQMITEACTSPHQSTTEYTVSGFYDKIKIIVENTGLYNFKENTKTHLQTNSNIDKPSKPLKVIIVPHSHNDPGWLQTVQTCYEDKTRNILTNTVKFLIANPDFTMIWSEIIFLDMWWREATHLQKSQFRRLVKTGQLEILSGGWVSPDEATTHYTAVLDQLIEGHQWLWNNIGVHVNTSWPLDQFGYSATLPYLWKKAGMNTMAILRVHGAIKDYMIKKKLLTFTWHQQWDESTKYGILCHVEPYMFANIARSCGPDTTVCENLDFIGIKDLPTNNLQSFQLRKKFYFNIGHFAREIVNQFKLKASVFRHNVIPVLHGDDFRYITQEDFQKQYKNLKRLMQYINSKKEFNVQVKFGTFGEYFKLVNEEQHISKNSQIPTISGDFFTYSDANNDYWSGYYTTRPFVKRMTRKLLELLRTTEAFTSFSLSYCFQNNNARCTSSNIFNDLEDARRTHGLVQHHDAITGTSRRHVMADFEKRIFDAISKLNNVLVKSIETIVFANKNGSQNMLKPLSYQRHPQDIVRRRHIDVNTGNVNVVFINSHTQTRKEVTSLLVTSLAVDVVDSGGNVLDIQISPYIDYQGREQISSNVFEVFFEIVMPPLSTRVYTVKLSTQIKDYRAKVVLYNGSIARIDQTTFRIESRLDKSTKHEKIILKNHNYSAIFSSKTGTLVKMCTSNESKCSNVIIDWLSYVNSDGNAYCFKQYSFVQQDEMEHHIPTVIAIKGRLVSKVHVLHPKFYHISSVYHTNGWQASSLHLENIANLDGNNDAMKELIMKISTDIVNKESSYFTDANGFQLIRRQYRKYIPIGGNFYPMTSMVMLQDVNTRLTLHSAQAHGVGSLRNGELEIMIDRAPIYHGKGLNEGISDNKPAQSKFLLTLENTLFLSKDNLKKPWPRTDNIDHPSLASININDNLQSPIAILISKKSEDFTTRTIQFLNNDLPCNYVVSNWKTFLTRNNTFFHTGVTLHRRMISCLFDQNICKTNPYIDFQDIFTNIDSKRIFRVSLTHILKKEVLYDNHIQVEPGDMESYKIFWE